MRVFLSFSRRVSLFNINLSSPSRRRKRDFNLAQLLSKGKVRDAIRLLSPVNQKGVLDPSQIIPDRPDNSRIVLQLLKEKHPESHSDALMDEPPEKYFPYTIFEALNEETIRFAALHHTQRVLLGLLVLMLCLGIVGVHVMVRSQSICVDPLQLLVGRYVPTMLIQLVYQYLPPAV